ncbi:hypothetical protein JD844_033327 [Phrynosoma platyrhinos]|uniref:Uncharacterized protein n=1 Tax=Phrynosoma platyrhinos TaxID=52577 RepID=A0ABQ7T670_PHRPL|nr:hypothetical protein JD844_033327 [Phrynosoma platyrhinos]
MEQQLPLNKEKLTDCKYFLSDYINHRSKQESVLLLNENLGRNHKLKLTTIHFNNGLSEMLSLPGMKGQSAGSTKDSKE